MFLRSQLRLQNDVLMGFFRFPMIGSLLRELILRITTIKTADHRVFKMATSCSKWLPLFLGDIFHCTGTRKWPPYGGSSLDEQVFRPLERIERFSMCFLFCLMRISLYSDFAGTDYPCQASHHCMHEIPSYYMWNHFQYYSSVTTSDWYKVHSKREIRGSFTEFKSSLVKQAYSLSK